MIIQTAKQGMSKGAVRIRAERAKRLLVEIEEGMSGSDEDCLHLYFDDDVVIESEQGHIVLRRKITQLVIRKGNNRENH